MSKGRFAEKWGPQAGSISTLKVIRSSGHLTLSSHLRPYETEVVVVH